MSLTKARTMRFVCRRCSLIFDVFAPKSDPNGSKHGHWGSQNDHSVPFWGTRGTPGGTWGSSGVPGCPGGGPRRYPGGRREGPRGYPGGPRGPKGSQNEVKNGPQKQAEKRLRKKRPPVSVLDRFGEPFGGLFASKDEPGNDLGRFFPENAPERVHTVKPSRFEGF